MRLHADEDVEVAWRSAVHPRLAFAGETDARAFLDAGGHIDRERPLLLDMTRAVARFAGILDHAALTAALRTGTFDGEETLLGANFADAAAGRALLGLRAGFRAGAAAHFARDGRRHLDLRAAALERFFETDLEIVAQVLPAIGAAPAPSAHELAEK